MSLAMFAASINDNSNITLPNSDNSDNILNQKRHKRTQRTYPKIEGFDKNKVNSVLESIHNNSGDDDDDTIDAFNPPPAPESAGVQKTIPKEAFGGMTTILDKSTIGKAPAPVYDADDNMDLNNYSNYGDAKTIDEYYRNVIPGYNQQLNNVNRQYYQKPQGQQDAYPTQDVLLQKLNYMISLLEDQQDERTNNVTEEVILYSFLGIFIIFMADTFVRVGKYTR